VKIAWVKLWLVAALVVATSSADAGPTPGSGEILLSVGTSANRGTVVCGLYDRNGWLKRPIRKATAATSHNVATCRFTGLPPGTYAAGAFYDQNSNGRLDRGWTGLPKEPWCVSRGPRPALSAPAFDAAKVSLSSGTVHVSCSAR
jgi:uncharacterized protein (DUF2141 family)